MTHYVVNRSSLELAQLPTAALRLCTLLILLLCSFQSYQSRKLFSIRHLLLLLVCLGLLGRRIELFRVVVVFSFEFPSGLFVY